MNARAYTVGSHIVFGAGEFSPATSSGRALLAHELAHTLQDSAGPLTIRRACAGESFYQSSPGYCRDDDFSPITHSGTTCYRQIPSRASGFECPPSQHFCFKPDGACEESPDRASIADGKDANGACSWNWFCVAQHVAADFLPAFGVQTGLFQLLQNVGTFGQIGGTLGEIGGELFDAGEDMYETGKGVYEIGEDLLDMLGLGDQ
jgi:hypothetical protein